MIEKILNSYKDLYVDAMRLYDIYRNLHADIGPGAINNSGMPKGYNISSRTEDDAIRLADAYIEFFDKFNEAKLRMIEIEKLINRVSDYRGRYVLHEHYINFRPIDEIGDDAILSRCGRQARRYHDCAIKELNDDLQKSKL